ncbi:hypothetical protein M501DRAFT_988601 [Patellaria atrata CBS 101060]|uniref:Cell wall mannoprotein PIR1-like C-terminal domain-containing protein n=1 Tax=Patellaria atrata CBS 101060 TaxID=1346257 RepID=A0A9P4SGA5_9PEZI|nr:hypothetical protein M501DRAFT_988601 [Patellaria atrata CBS 101060]
MKYTAALFLIFSTVWCSPHLKWPRVPYVVPSTVPAGCVADFNGSFGLAVMSLGPKTKRTVNKLTILSTSLPVHCRCNSAHAMDRPCNCALGTSYSVLAHSEPLGDDTSESDTDTDTDDSDYDTDSECPPGPPLPAISQIPDGQIQAPPKVVDPSIPAISQIPDGQIQAPPKVVDPPIPAISQIPDGQVQAPSCRPASTTSSGKGTFRSCIGPSTLRLYLSKGQLRDSVGRTGYIASNHQFQFDNPPQGNALSHGGYSVCGDKLALRGNKKWFRCRSGDFYNLYEGGSKELASWGQCESVGLRIVELVELR